MDVVRTLPLRVVPCPKCVPTSGPPTLSAGVAETSFRSATKKRQTGVDCAGSHPRYCWWCEVGWTSDERVCWACGRTDGVRTIQPIVSSQVQAWRESQGRS